MNVDIGIMYPEMPLALGRVVPYAEAARRGAHRLWFGHSNVIDSHATMAALAGRGYALPFGTGVVLHPLWHPHGFAVQALSIARLTGQSYVAGIGPGAREFQIKTLGGALPAPVAATEAFTAEVRRIVPQPLQTHPERGDVVDPSFGSVEIGYGVLRPGMARAAGRSAEWAITWLAPGRYLREVLVPGMTAAAEDVGRLAPRVAAIVHLAVDRPGRNPDRIALRAVGAHLRADHYVDMLRRSGVEVDPSDPEEGARRVVRAGVFLHGSPDEIVDGIEALGADGAGEVVLNVYGVSQEHGGGSALDDLEEVLEVVRRRRIARLHDTATRTAAAPLAEPALAVAAPEPEAVLR